MSRVRQEIASVQFQLDARNVNAAMQALQRKADELSDAIEGTKQSIADLGNVKPDNTDLLNFQQILKSLKKDYDDVVKAQRDYVKGVKAADQLYKAAQMGDIESLSFRAIKAGQNGLRKRQEGLSPKDAEDMKEWRAYQAVIEESDRVVNEARADVEHTIETIQQGGKVSEQTLRRTVTALKDLKGSVEEGTSEWRTYSQQFDFMNTKLDDFTAAQRRARGEMVDANDARREALKLTDEGRRQAEYERKFAEWQIKFYEQDNQHLEKKRQQQEAEIEQTRKQIEAQKQLIEEKHKAMAKDDERFRREQERRQKQIDGYKQDAQNLRDLADDKKAAAEEQIETEKYWQHQVNETGQEITKIKDRLAEIQAQKAGPNPTMEAIKTGAEEAGVSVDELKARLEKVKSDARYNKARIDYFPDLFKDQAPTLEEEMARIRKRAKELEQNVSSTMQTRRERVDAMLSEGQKKSGLKKVEFDYLKNESQLLNYFDRIKAEGPKVKKEFESLSAEMKELKIHGFDFEGLFDSDIVGEFHKRLENLKHLLDGLGKDTAMNLRPDGTFPDISKMKAWVNEQYEAMNKMKESYQASLQKVNKASKTSDAFLSLNNDTQSDYPADLISIKRRIEAYDNYQRLTKEQIELERQIADAENQGTQATDKLTEAQNLYNQKVQERIKKEQELEAIKNRRYTDDPEIKRLDAEIAKLEELISVSDKYRSQFAKMSDKKFEEGFMGKEGRNGDPKKSIYGAFDYLERAYDDKLLKAPLAGGGYQDEKEYQAAAERVAKGIVQNAQENVRRVIFKEIEDGNWTSEEMERQLDTWRSRFATEFRNARPGQVKDDPEYNAYKYIIAQMEKYLEVAKQVEAERAKIAGGKDYLELAKAKDILSDEKREGLQWQKEKREWDRLSIKTDEIEGRKKEDERIASEAVTKAKHEEESAESALNEEKRKSAEALVAAKQKESDAIKAGTQAKKESTQAQKESTDATKEEEALQQKLSDKQRENADAQNNLTQAKKDSAAATGEAAEADKNAAAAEGTLADATKKANDAQADFNKTQEQGLQEIDGMGKALDGMNAKLEGQQKVADDIAKKQTANDEAISEAQKKKAQAQELTVKKMEDLIAILRKANQEDIPANTEKWKENEAEINRLTIALDKMKEASRLDMIKQQGQTALDFFSQGRDRAASAAETAEQVKALAAYRDILPKEEQADTIRKINEYIEANAEAVKIATGEWMSYEEAQKLASKAGGEGFIATTKQMQQAQQALERYRDQLIKSIQKRRENVNMTKEEKDALAAEEKELKNVTNQLKSMEFEMQHTGMSAKRMEEILKDLTAAKNIEELGMAVKRSQAQLKLMEETVGRNNREYDTLAKKTKEAAQRQKEMETQFKASASSFEKAWSRLKTYVTLYVGAAAAMQKLTGTIGDLMELSDKMGEVRKTTGFTADEVGRLSNNLKKLDTRTTITGLLDLSVAAGQLGLKTQEDVEGFTEAANKLMVALPEMGKEGATEMLKVALATGEIAKIEKQMREGLVEGSSATAVAMEKVGSTIDRLRATSAATAPAITDFVKRVGAVGAQSGISIDQVAALGSTVDALGMRVEMSATALSRMIPAIKNNAFAVAKAIGVTPETLRSLFEAGRGMEAILMIFQHIKDAGMDADSIESMLGMGNMKEIMKELNQMGARAGIVFSGLSQNVDELRRQLNVAGDAYKQNIAIQQEYDKMNETTAAKWERLKNQIEEMFVGDEAQSWLGKIIDGLRTIVDLLSGPMKGAFMGALAGLGSYSLGLGGLLEKLKDFATGEESVSEKIKEWWDKLKEGNVWDIVVSGTIAAGFALYEYLDSLKEAAREVARFNEELVNEQNKVEDLTKSITAANTNVEDAEKEVAKAREEVEKAKKALDEAKKSTDDTKEATDKLAEAESKLIVEEEKKRNSMAEQKKLVEQFNSLYSKYLGFMISEISSTNELNKARDLLNTKLRETITLKRKEAALNRLEESEGEGRDSAYSELSLALGSAFRKQVVVGHDKNKKEVKAWTEDRERNAALLRQVTELAQSEKLTAKQVEEALAKAGLSIYETGRNGEKRINAYGANIRNLVMNYSKEYKNVQKKVDDVMIQFDVEASLDRKESQEKLSEQYKASASRYGELEKEYANATGKAKKQAAANLLKQADTLEEMITAAPNYYDLNNESEKASYEKFVKDTQARIDGIKDQREALIKEAGNAYQSRKNVSGNMTTGGGGENPWGSRLPAESTAYADMSADVLVNRRKQMKDFVNAIQTDTDVQSVLKEDAALKKAIENGMSSDMRTVVEWYNTERLKIQDELYKRHLTNTGDWLDPKKSKESWRKQLQTDLDNYLKMLDAYYTKRKAEIQEAGNDEGLAEAEIRNRQAANDTEWQQRRLELQQIYLGKREKVAKDEVTAIMAILAEMDEDTPEMVEKLIGKSLDKWKILEEKAPEMARRLESKFVSGVSQSMLKMQQIVHQQMKAIEDILDKERPFNGITKSLRENLVTMDILTADMREEYRQLMKEGKDTSDFDRRQKEEEVKRTTFLLGEAENAYTTTVEEVMRRMADAGMTAWAEELRQSPKMQEALMAQLHQTYDAIQEAIKKEASLMKKQAETMWNNILMPGGDGKTTVKDAFEQAIAQLGIDQGRVSRANSLIGAGVQSERVADKLAIKQMQLQLNMQQHYYNLIQKQGRQRIDDLQRQIALAKQEGDIERQKRLEQDKQHVEMSLRLALTKEQTEELKLQEDIIARTEESENRLYQSLREWADLLTSSLQGVMEASNAGNAEYYNELAKMNLTGKGGPGAGTYIVIDNEGTEDATAHYEYLDERAALERQREIEQQNAQAEAWQKLWDDLNQKMSDQITDWMNASLQNEAIDKNTTALGLNTQALYDFLNGMTGGQSSDFSDASKLQRDANGMALDSNGQVVAPIQPTEVQQEGMPKPTWQMTDEEYQKTQENIGNTWTAYKEYGLEALQEMSDATAGMPSVVVNPYPKTEEEIEQIGQNTAAAANAAADAKIAASNRETETVVSNADKQKKATTEANNQEVKSTQSSFAKMAAACNMYGIAYQTMSNDNLDTFQKFQMFALQAAGQTAIAMLTTDMAKTDAEGAVKLPGILGEAASQLGPIAGPIAFAAMTALLGGLMAVAVSKVAKSKSQISQVTGASVSAGRLATGMMTYKDGNVDAFTDPSTLTPGRQYNVDGADGRTYRARYMGSNPKTHLTNGPEFHLAGERGREMIIDAGTTRQITMNENEIWHAIQTLSAGGRMPSTRRRGRGVKAFAEGNVEDFEEMGSMGDMSDTGGMDLAAMQASLDRNSAVQEALLERLNQPIYAQNILYGPDGLPNVIAKLQKEAQKHGEKYL